MNTSTLQKANELTKIIEITEKAITTLKKRSPSDERESTKLYDDGLYRLSINEHSDSSGISANLNRYTGNVKLYNVILAELEQQLKDFKDEFNSM